MVIVDQEKNRLNIGDVVIYNKTSYHPSKGTIVDCDNKGHLLILWNESIKGDDISSIFCYYKNGDYFAFPVILVESSNKENVDLWMLYVWDHAHSNHPTCHGVFSDRDRAVRNYESCYANNVMYSQPYLLHTKLNEQTFHEIELLSEDKSLEEYLSDNYESY